VTPLPGAGLIAFESYRDGNGEIYVIDTRRNETYNVTHHPAHDRAPAWRPDGEALAFESHRDGNWEIYVLELSDGTLTRLTDNPAYDGAPAWGPGDEQAAQIAFESYRDGDLEIYAVAQDGGQLRRLTDSLGGDYGPDWHPSGDWIAFTSWRDGSKDIYVMPASGGEPVNVSQHPADDECPAWAPDGQTLAFTSWRDEDPSTGNRNAEIYTVTLELSHGPEPVAEQSERATDSIWPDLDPAWDAEGRLVWAAYDPGQPFETYDPYRPGDYHLYRRSDRGDTRLTDSSWDDRNPAPAPAVVPALHDLEQEQPAETSGRSPSPQPSGGALAQIVEVPGVLASYLDQPVRVSELVAPSLRSWRQDLLAASGHDFLHSTLGAWRFIDQLRKKEMYAYDYGYLSWHKAGRAIDLALEHKVDGADQLRVVREDLGENTYWRLYLKAAKQDGSQGEPLKENPWLYWWHIVPESEPDVYDAGGKRLPIPSGYFVDVTAIAKRHGWERIAAYAIDGDYHWTTDSNGTEYWHYERADGLIWWDAMSQIYPSEMLVEHVGWEAGLRKAQTEEMMSSKGIPTPAP
jgi:TolB protein